MRIRFRTWTYRPPRRVTCRLVGGESPRPEYAGLFRDGMWVFDLGDEVGEGTTFVLAVDGQVESDRRTDTDLDEQAVSFLPVPVAVDDNRLQQTWFAEGVDIGKIWDVVTVGTGMGGGVLLAGLTSNQLGVTGPWLDVLALEAGSLLFPTHVGNLPEVRFGKPAGFATTLWNTLETFGTRPWSVSPGTQWDGYEVFAFGGRSLYWGALCPRLADSELRKWPETVCAELGDWYVKAEQLLAVGHPRADDVARDGIALLDAVCPDRRNRLAPVALRREKATSWSIPAGLFSTAQLLLQLRLSDEQDGGAFGVPYIHLSELVVRLEWDEAAGYWIVHGVDLRDGSSTRRLARQVALCAGTIESARILASSDISLGTPAGQGLTEHPMAYMHFEIPPSSPFYHPGSATDLLSVPGDGGGDWIFHLQLGSDLVLGQHDPLGVSGTATSEGSVAGQLVFQGRADLGDGAVTFDPAPWPVLNVKGGALPSATLEPTARDDRHWPVWKALAHRLATLLGARGVGGNGTPELIRSGRGTVAHEVGTLRMSADGSGAVTPDLAVEGQKALYVCDNSVFPTSPAANPSLTLAALALRLADRLRNPPHNP